MLISSRLNVPLGALRQQQQQRTSTLAPNWHFWRVVGRTRHKKHAAGHCLWDNLIIWTSMLVSALLNVPLGALRQQAAGEHFGTEMALLAGCGAHKTQKTRSRALSAGQPHHMGLYAHICTSKCAAGSPTPAAAAAGELFCTEWALFSFFLFMINKKKEKDSLSRNKFP